MFEFGNPTICETARVKKITFCGSHFERISLKSFPLNLPVGWRASIIPILVLNDALKTKMKTKTRPTGMDFKDTLSLTKDGKF